jgi:hypothetical protein
MDDIVEDARREVEVLLGCWQTQGTSGGIFRNHIGEAPTSEASSEYYSDEPNRDSEDNQLNQNNVRFVISDLSQSDAGGVGRASVLSAISPGTVKGSSQSEYFAAEEGNAGGFDFRREGAVTPGASPLRIAGTYGSTEDIRGQSRLDVTGGKKLAWSDEN